MSSCTSARDALSRARDSPLVWFAALVHARRVGDADLARRARRHLLRRGVLVRFVTPPPEAEPDSKGSTP